MSLSASEQAIINFYQWEYRNRGYYHFETPIDIEAPYIPFNHKQYVKSNTIDDGRVPSLFSRICNLISPPKKELEPKDDIRIEPTFLSVDKIAILVGFSLSFLKGQEILPLRNTEFLNMLSFTDYPVSFEILGTYDNIQIQIICSEQDSQRINSHLKAYFPNVITKKIEVENLRFNTEKNIAIADFGVHDEFMRPIKTTDSFSIDPLTSIIATFDSLQHNDIALFQVLFKGVTSPLAKDIPYSVSDGHGESFFIDAPEMVLCAKEKIAMPLFSVVMRIAVQCDTDNKSQYLASEFTRSITSASSSKFNKLIPLSNEGYHYDFHKYNVYHRLSNRLGFVLNSKELNMFIHYPNKSVISTKLGLQSGKTKLLPKECINQKYVLGFNTHNGNKEEVGLNDIQRLKHCHIIGVTGTGKTTLLGNMMLADMHKGNGCALFDPHGDIIDDLLLRIPEHRKDDVVIIDPSDTEFPIGFNLFGATTDAEKIVLSSDLVSAFKRHATAWGDNMTAVLSNAINTFLESNHGGTLIELKRFLIEDSFRKEFLKSVDDPSIDYYWENEYQMVKKGIAPLLTRIDTFLRPKIVRYMLAQNDGVDFRECIEQKKIVLIKLSQGLIGEDNSYLLGSLFLSKFNQVAQGRQVLPIEKRHPYYIYLDEFQNFITPSIVSILSGARKYGLGIILAHQELGQIEDVKILNSVISNPYARICFRLGDNDAKKLESGFSYFKQDDLQDLDTGQAIIRIGNIKNDCNISTSPLDNIPHNAFSIRESIVQKTRAVYSKPRADIEILLKKLLPQISKPSKETKEHIDKIPVDEVSSLSKEEKSKTITNDVSLEEEKEKYINRVKENETVRKHRSLQNYVRTMALQRDFKATLEQETENGGRVDIALTKDNIRIAVEISVTNTLDYEVKNIQKCIDSGYHHICMLSESMIHLKNIKKRANRTIEKSSLKKVQYLIPLEFTQYLDSFSKKATKEKRTRGYRVKSNHIDISSTQLESKNTTLQNIILSSLKKGS